METQKGSAARGIVLKGTIKLFSASARARISSGSTGCDHVRGSFGDALGRISCAGREGPSSATGPGVAKPVDSGAADSGAADSGAADSGAADSGAADSGAADSGATGGIGTVGGVIWGAWLGSGSDQRFSGSAQFRGAPIEEAQ